MPTCGLVHVKDERLVRDCHRPATHRLTSSTDPWPLQYACTEHRDDVAPELDTREPIGAKP